MHELFRINESLSGSRGSRHSILRLSRFGGLPFLSKGVQITGVNRRQFIQTSAAGVALTGLHGYAGDFGDLKKRVALIGSGWYGKCDLLRLIQVAPVEVVALCDVDRQMATEAAEIVASRQVSGKKPRLYGDYLELLKQEQLDLALVDTPDHWHALPAIEAMRRGVDVWVQKPVGVDVVEGQAMVAAARKYGRVVQVGMQRRSTPHLVEARDRVVREGLLGKVSHVEICCYYHMRARGTPEWGAVPENLDYDMWTGPAPMRPYNSWVHPRSWRAFMEYGNGIVGDMCVHMLDMVRWMLDLGWPKSISSQGGILVDPASAANITDTQTAVFDFGELQAVWQHRSWGSAPDPEYPWAAFIYGENGVLKASVNKSEFIPRGGGAGFKNEAVFEFDQYPEDETEKDLERHVAAGIRGQMRDFLACIESRQRPVADIEEGHISGSSCILANLSMELGRTLHWDEATGGVVGDEEANARLARAYRSPWVHPTPDSV